MTEEPIRRDKFRWDMGPKPIRDAVRDMHLSDADREIIQKLVRSAFYTQLFEMLAKDDAEPTTFTEAMLLARERATYGRTASKPSSAGSSEPPPTA